MKYGVLYFKNTLNIGDDIQTYASLKYYPKVDYYIDRENMDKFVPDNKEKVASITNGWFVHNSLNFPPSPYILPLPIAMHFSLKHVHDIKGELFHLGKEGINYLKSIEPIMCRDTHTDELLSSKGVKTEYSGCMTLTIPKFKDVKKQEYICAVDVSDEVLEKLKSMTDLEIKVISHQVDESYSELSFDERMNKVEELLKIYQGAKYIVTPRLHVALPATALGTKALVIYIDYNEDRFKNYLEYIDFVEYNDFLNEDYTIDFDNDKSTDKHLPVVNNLNNKCTEFIKKYESLSNEDMDKLNNTLPDTKFYNAYVVKKVEEYKKLCLKLQDKYVNEQNKQFVYEKQIEELNNNIEKLKKENDILNKDLYDIQNRILYKTLDKCTNILKPFRRK